VPSFGEYELTRRLGVGGMGEVWIGQRTALGGAAKTVAIKLMARERARDPNARKMFIDEARLSMLLANSNIVQVFDVGESEDKTCYMVMELVEGLDLAELTQVLRDRGDKLPAVISGYIVGEVLKALAYAHDLRHEGTRKTIVHRDISPHNVMLSVSGEVKIMDFGIARMASEETSGVHVKGKLRYMPPEQLRGESREPTLDLFAVGAILHELLDGSKFRSSVVDEARLYGMILDGEIPQLECPQQDVPRELDELRLGLLRADPAQRIPSARAAYKLLMQWRDYRDARFELEEIIATNIGSVQKQEVGATAILAGNSVTFGDGSGSDVQRTAILNSDGSETDLSRTAPATGSHDYPHPGMSQGATAVQPRQPQAAGKPNHARLVSVALAVFGLGFGVFGLGATLGWWSDDKPEVVAEHEPEVVAEPKPEVVAEPEPEVVIEAEPEPEPEPEPELEEPGSGPVKPATTTIKTTISAPGFRFWVEIKIGGRTFEIDSAKRSSVTTRFKPGSYNVQFRDNAKGSWSSAGQIKIPEHGNVSLELQKGGKVTVH
jgi:serine/threonine protein kinase